MTGPGWGSRALNDLDGRELAKSDFNTLGQQIALDDLAQAAGYSRFHFLRTFTKTLGMTPSKYVMHRRVQAAVSMAKGTRESLASIAYATGFADQSHLSRWCRKVYGVPLSEMRPH